MRFGTAFKELEASDLPTTERCSVHSAIRYLGLAMLQDYVFDVGNRISIFYGKDADPTLARRTHRRLLSAMKRLSDDEMDSQETKAALIGALAAGH